MVYQVKIRHVLKEVKSIYLISKFCYEKKEHFFSKLRFFLFTFAYVFNINLFKIGIPISFYKDNKYITSKHDLESILEGIVSSEYFDQKSIELRNNLFNSSVASNQNIAELQSKGYSDISSFFNFNTIEIEKFVTYALSSQAYNAQVPIASSKTLMTITNDNQYYSLHPDDKFLVAYYRKILANPFLKKMADEYLGFKSSLYGMNTMITTPNKNLHSVTDLHRDRDDVNFLTVFLYWTKTNALNGATYFVPGSHLKLNKHAEGIYLESNPGTVIAADTFALHSGNKNVKDIRVVSWFRFGRKHNAASFGSKNYLFINLYEELYS